MVELENVTTSNYNLRNVSFFMRFRKLYEWETGLLITLHATRSPVEMQDFFILDEIIIVGIKNNTYICLDNKRMIDNARII